MADSDAIFVGGPSDDTVFAAPDSGLVEVPIEGLTHRYILTSATRERDGKDLPCLQLRRTDPQRSGPA